jgi:hypothetical protein
MGTQVTDTKVADKWAADMPVDLRGELAPRQEVAPAGVTVQAAEILDIGNGWARMRVTLKEDGRIYRQTRVYQDGEWLRAGPSGVQWGRPRQWESEFFLFRYYAQDEAAVYAAAPKLDALYPTFYAALTSGGASMASDPPSQKLVVEIDPTATLVPGNGATMAHDLPLILPSPNATLAPLEVSEEALLVQGAALALFNRLAAQSDALNNLPERRAFLHSGLRLWLLWDQELPLARWREPLVRWVFGIDEGVRGPSGKKDPAFAHDFCAHHRLWLRSEEEIDMPVICVQYVRGGEAFLTFRYSSPPHMLPSFVTREESQYTEESSGAVGSTLHYASVVMYATLFEYISMREGIEENRAEENSTEAKSAETIRAQRVAALIAAIPNHTNWDSLIRALYGEPQRDFEAGWNAFLAERYGIAP